MKTIAVTFACVLGASVGAAMASGPETAGNSGPDVRAEAARLLKAALAEGGSPAQAQRAALAAAADRAAALLGPHSHVGREIAGAAGRAAGAAPNDVAAASELRAALQRSQQDLAFRPVVEAEMPEGFPLHTPVGEVELRHYPAYRMAETRAAENRAFWTLLQHIKRNNVAMTAPVEMEYDAPDTAPPRPRSMAFLYGSPDVGQPGAQGTVEVKDVPAMTVVSTGVRGLRTQAALDEAVKRLDEWLARHADQYERAGPMRVMGHNSPFVPRDRQYFEVQVPLKAKGVQAG